MLYRQDVSSQVKG